MALPARAVLLVTAGGAAGTVLRALLTREETVGLPLLTLTVNVAGAFALGLLLAVLDRRPGGSALRLVLGIGLFGAFTTWSGLAVQSVLLVRDGAVGTALAYLALSLGGGLLAATAGLLLGGARR